MNARLIPTHTDTTDTHTPSHVLFLMLRIFAASARRAIASPRRATSAGPMMSVRWNQQAAAESHIFDEHDGLRRRLLYRSKQRGWLEMDIMLGNWASDNLGRLDGPALQQFCLLYTSPSPRDRTRSRMPSSA